MISADIIFQNIPQIKLKYPNDIWQIILGNCDAQLFLGCTDPLTSGLVSDRSGVTTVRVTGQQKWLPTIRLTEFVPTYRQNTSVGKRMLLTADEVQRLPEDQALLILRGQNLLRLNKFEYWNHPESRKLQPVNINDYVPEWQHTQKEATRDIQQEIHENVMTQVDDPKHDVIRQRNAEIHTQARRKKILINEDQQSLFIDNKEYAPKKPDEI